VFVFLGPTDQESPAFK